MVAKRILFWLSITAVILLCYKSCVAEEGFDWNGHEWDNDYELQRIDAFDKVYFTHWYKDGCVLGFYIERETGIHKGWHWERKVSHERIM